MNNLDPIYIYFRTWNNLDHGPGPSTKLTSYEMEHVELRQLHDQMLDDNLIVFNSDDTLGNISFQDMCSLLGISELDAIVSESFDIDLHTDSLLKDINIDFNNNENYFEGFTDTDINFSRQKSEFFSSFLYDWMAHFNVSRF